MLQDKYQIYILSYNEDTYNTALEKFNDKLWANVININTTIYLENIMYNSWLINHKNDWINSDYVGTLSWRSFQKIKIPKLDDSVNSVLINKSNADVVVFAPISMNLLYQASRDHGKRFKSLWIYLIKSLGFSAEQAIDPTVKLFFCNYWMAKPNVMMDYIDFFSRAKFILENDQEIQDDLWSNSNYNGYVSKEKLMEIFGRPYYPFHPFLLERLPCFFFHQKHKVLPYTER
jgi:hypothetical protein